MTNSEILQVFLQERVENAVESNLFYEELRRMEAYDSLICPEEWRGALEFVKKKGLDMAGLFKNFAERSYVFPLEAIEHLAQAYNIVKTANAAGKTKFKKMNSPFDAAAITLENYKGLMETGVFRVDNPREPRTYFRLDDSVKGFELLFSIVPWNLDKVNKKLDGPSSIPIYGIFESPMDDGLIGFNQIGGLTLDGLKPVSQRRFVHTFGIPIVEYAELADALAKINGLPAIDGRGYNITYGFEVNAYPDLENRGLDEILREVEKAKAKRLFSDVKVYDLVSRVAKFEPVQVVMASDIFGNEYPVTYFSENINKK